MRITVDGTPLLGHRTGIGRYVDELIRALPGAAVRRDLDLGIGVSTWTARGARLEDLPPGVHQVGPRVPARLLRSAWSHGDHPRIEAMVGKTDVFHGTNFVSPPTRSAAEVVTVHDLTYELHQDTVSADSLHYRTLVRRALDRGARVVTPSEAVAAAVRDFYGVDRSRVTATPLGVDPTWFDAEAPAPSTLAELGLPSEYLLFVGSLDPRKNLTTLISAHAAATARDHDLPPLVLAGPAGREEHLAQNTGVFLTGWLSTDVLQSLVAGCRALALPSLDEGFGLPALEALAAGRPVLISRTPALQEVTAGLAVETAALDIEEMADALIRVSRTGDDVSAAARRQSRAREFTWARCADRTIDVYLDR